MEEWTEIWPVEPGHYWFFGWCSESLVLVKVSRTMNSIAYVGDGCFIYRGEGALGLWKRAELPGLPVEALVELCGLCGEKGENVMSELGGAAILEIAESAWLESWKVWGASVFPGDFRDFVAQKERFLSAFGRLLTKEELKSGGGDLSWHDLRESER